MFARVVRPLIRLLNWMANVVVRLVGVEPQDERAMAHSPSELLLLIDESAGRGGIAADEHQLLARSLELSGLTAADAMTPRRDIVAVPAEATAADVAAEAHRTGRTRVIVHEGDLDHVRGFVHVKDVIRLDMDTWPTTAGGQHGSSRHGHSRAPRSRRPAARDADRTSTHRTGRSTNTASSSVW